MKYDSSTSDLFDSILAYGIFAFAFITPAIIALLIIFKKSSLNMSIYGSFFEGLNQESSLSLTYTILILLRRLIFSFSVTILADYTGL